MLTKSKIQYLKSLHDKLGRRESGCFLVEGRKGIEEFVASDFEIMEGFFLEDDNYSFPHETISVKELEKISALTSNNFGLIVVKMKKTEHGLLSPREGQGQAGLTLMLDGINDPGNLGTIIRTADWYGITDIIASLDTVDCYSSKVIMATMGSFTRIHIEYRDLEEFFVSVTREDESIKISKKTEHGLLHPKGTSNASQRGATSQGRVPIYGAYLEGESVHEKNFSKTSGYLVIGSESHGIRPHLEKYITDKITIPRYGEAESLNAGVATAIILDNIRREISRKKV